MKIYIVIEINGRYEDEMTSIEGVFSTEEKAKFYKKKLLQDHINYYKKTYENKGYNNFSYEDYMFEYDSSIEEFELDKIKNDK